MATADDKHYRARITKRVDLAPELWMIRIDPGAEFKFTPGQYATLGVQGEDKRSERPYSIVSSPYEKEIEFFFELVPHGELTPKIYSLKTGDEVLMRKSSKGRFILDRVSGRKNHLLVCTVTGVAPYVSFVRTLYKDWKEGTFTGDHKLFLLNGASRSWEFGYSEELQRYAQEVPWLKYVPTVSRPWDDPKWTGESPYSGSMKITCGTLSSASLSMSLASCRILWKLPPKMWPNAPNSGKNENPQ